MPVTSARELAKPKPKRTYKRPGRVTNAEKDLVAQVVQDQSQEMTPAQVNALARTMRRSRSVVKELIEGARERFVDAADRYVEVHKLAVEGALLAGDHEQAIKGSQWYLEHVSAEGVRIIDKAASGPQGTKIMIGVKIGGVSESPTAITVPAIVVEPNG